ncbi:MAG: DNA polymerase III subunit delta' [Candidatus Nanopelagicales bacterium]
MSVWEALVGQEDAVADLRRAVADARGGPDLFESPESVSTRAMTHAWLVTGPPGSGRSVAAVTFAAALVCPHDGCGECDSCRQARAGSHPDVEVVRPDRLSYGVEEARRLVRRAANAPTQSHWHVLVIEDADRLTDEAVSALLKAIEEPTPHTVWLLCAPSVEDVLPTIRSRTRLLQLRTPPIPEVAEALVTRFGVDPAMASFAARAAQGHIGRARALATDEQARLRRQEVLRVPFRLRDLPSCFAAAADLLDAATEDAHAITDPIDAREQSDLMRAYGEGSEGVTQARVSRLASAALKDLQDRQKSRRTRTVRDQIDRALVDLLALYRDVLAVQVEAGVPLVNEELRVQLAQLAAATSPDGTLLRMEAVSRARLAMQANVAPLLALEALTVELRDPEVRRDAG